MTSSAAAGFSRFHPRCDYATAECRARRPDAHAVEGAHRVRCYHPLSAA